MFTIQCRDGNGRWRENRYAPRYRTLDDAIAYARNLDQDGLFPGDTRIVDVAGKPVMTARQWFALQGM